MLDREVQPAQLRPGYYMALVAALAFAFHLTAFTAGQLWGKHLNAQRDIDQAAVAARLDLPASEDPPARSQGVNYGSYFEATGGSSISFNVASTESYAAYFSASGDNAYALATSGDILLGNKDTVTDTVTINGRLVVDGLDVAKELKKCK